MPKPAGRKRIMRKFTIDELSSVDVPAQEGARALIMKRADGNAAPAKAEKNDVVQAVTGAAEGHIHGIRVRRYGDGEVSLIVSYAMVEGAEQGHDHMLYRDPDGTYSVLQNAGHTHSLDSTALNAAIVSTVQKREDEPMTPEEKARLEKLQKQLDRTNAIVALAADLRTHFDGLPDEAAQDAFLAKSVEDRKADVRKAADEAAAAEAARNAGDPVVHTTRSGIEIRKSDGAAALALAKQADADREENAGLREQVRELTSQTSQESYEKRAREELPDVPGSVAERAALLKAIDGIEDEGHRKAALAALRSKGDGIAALFKTAGTGDPGAPDDGGDGDPSDRLEALAKQYRKDHPELNLTYEQAEARVMDTPEGQELYDEIAKRGTHTVSEIAA